MTREPTPDERQWLQLVCDHFLADGAWPSEADLQLELDRRDVDLNVEEVAHNLPQDLGYLRHESDRPARITVRGMTYCTGSDTLLQQFIRAVELFAAKYLAHEKVTKAELQEAIGGSERDAHRVFMLLDREQHFLWDGDGPEGEWTRAVNRQAREFRKVHSVDEYVATLDRLATAKSPYREALDRAVEATARMMGPFESVSEQPTTSPAPDESEESGVVFDAFIAHAGADKLDVASPLAMELQRRGYAVWYDDWALKVGDSLGRRIDAGLARSRYGVVILSPDFFKRAWPRKELDGLEAREAHGEKVILPVWHKLSANDVAIQSPMLAGRIAARTERGIAEVADAIAEVLGPARQQ